MTTPASKTMKAIANFALILLAACGGATTNQPPAEPSSQATSEVASVEVVQDAPPLIANEQVVGLWCQYWIPPAGEAATNDASAPERRADTAQYLFLPDGRFGWRAESSAGSEPKKQSGTWHVSGSAIVLSDDDGQVIEQLAIADCPSNPEAERLDAQYRCRSLAGQAFWLSKPAEQVDASRFIQ